MAATPTAILVLREDELDIDYFLDGAAETLLLCLKGFVCGS
jgi:hypothetical protein